MNFNIIISIVFVLILLYLSFSYKKREKKIEEKIERKILKRKENVEFQIETLEQSLDELEEDYAYKKVFLEQKRDKIEQEIEQEIEQKREEVNKLITHLKEEEKNKKKKDFYRIVLSEAERDDIKRLESFAPQLNNASLIYKLIWETYIKKNFDLMCGRVLGKDTDLCGIYKITNINNGMTYIGQTKASFKTRWRTHCRRAVKAEEGSMNKLYSSMWEEGIDKFSFSVVEIIDKSKGTEYFNQREKFYIDFYQAKEFGYNSKAN